jgi:hypothetical protein
MRTHDQIEDDVMPTLEQQFDRLSRQRKIREAKLEKIRLGQIPELSVAELDQILGDTEGGASKWRRRMLQNPARTHR